MTTEFPSKVQNIVGPTLANLGFFLDGIDDGRDEGGRQCRVVYYKSGDCKMQVYWSSREGETNCMIAPLSAPNKFGLRTVGWHYLASFAEHPDLSLEELVASTTSEFESYTEPLEWVRDCIVEYFGVAHAGIAEMNGLL